MRHFLELPDIECPSCERARLRTSDGTFASRVRLLTHQALLHLARRLLGLRYRCGNCRRLVYVPRELPRTVVGYHGCDRTFAAHLVAGRLDLRDWLASEKDYDWLGAGIYFWEHAPGRAWQWAAEHYPGQEAVVAVEIRLGHCLDLADTIFTELLREAYDGLKGVYEARGAELPKNTGGKDKKARRLDCLVLDHMMEFYRRSGRKPFQTIRCPFEEGAPAFPGGNIRLQSHIQVAVKDTSCFLPTIHLIPKVRS